MVCGMSVKDNSKHKRILDFYVKLTEGGVINTKNEATKYDVDEKTIQRDINALRDFMESKTLDSGEINNIVYNRRGKGFQLEKQSLDKFTNSEVLAICKILLDSRAFTKDEMDKMIEKLLNFCVPVKNQKIIERLIGNEQHHYTELCHKTVFIDKLWDIGNAIRETKIIEIKYKKMSSGKEVVRRLKPLSIMFSEFYFYLIAFIKDMDEEINYEYKEAIFPTNYRVDRIADLKVTNERFKIPYRNRFEEGEFRKRIQFMYGGELRRIKLKCRSESLEAILDRLPTAEILSKDDDIYTIEAEVFGKGVDMWVRSQGDGIEVFG